MEKNTNKKPWIIAGIGAGIAAIAVGLGKAFRDMKESAKRQREIDKANFKAQKMETKAFYQEQKAKRNPEVRKMVQEQEYQKQMAEAKARQEAAQKRIDEAKNNQ